jgi:type IV pilus assembly protein PilW
MNQSRYIPRLSSPRGFTLLELLVGAVVTTIILAAVAMSFVGVQGSYQAESQIKSSVEGLRTGTAFIEQRLRLAGYGVDPRFAFDFGTAVLPGGTKSNLRLEVPGAPPVFTDDLAFRYRDPAWMRRGTWNGGIQLENDAEFGMDFPPGQRFIISCVGGSQLVVRAGGGVPRAARAAGNLVVDEQLSAIAPTATCLRRNGVNAPYVMLLHEVRVRITLLDNRPFLVAYPNLDVLDDALAVPLVADVESFQVAYRMNRPPPGSAHGGLPPVDDGSPTPNWILGDVGSPAADAHPNPAVLGPIYETPYDHETRYNRHPANIRAVHLTLAVRSARPEPGGRRAFERVNLEDSIEAAPADGYYRSNLTTMVRVPNLLSRSHFNPPVGGAPLNVWGG